MRSVFLPFSPPDIGDEEVAEVEAALRSGWITSGPRTRSFESAFTEYVGARPILVDVEPQTLTMDPSAAAAAIERSEARVRVIEPVHLHGHPCDMGALLELAETNDLWVVDDAAHAIPASVGGRPIGGSRHPRVVTAFSFYATKNLATGEGGMLTGPRTVLDEARKWVLHGMTNDAWRRHEAGAEWRYDVDRAGFKYNLSDVQAALGLVQLKRLPAMHARRRDIASRYRDGLGALEELELPVERPGTGHAWHIFAIRLRLDRLSITRERFIHELRERNIGTSVHFIPLHSFTYYRTRYGLRDDDFPVASAEFERLVSLPIYPTMRDQDVDDVIEAITDIIREHHA